MKLTLVNCPECHHEFDASQQFEQHEEHFKQMELQLQEQQNQMSQLDSKNNHLQEQYSKSLELLADKEEEFKKDLELKTKDIISQSFEDGRKSIDIEAIKHEASVKAQIEMEGLLKNETDKLFHEGLSAGKNLAQTQNEEELMEIKRELNNKEIENQRYKDHIADLHQKSKQKNVELQGEAQELLIEKILDKHFSNDGIQQVKKGANGADCILTINHGNKLNIGKIAFESKDTKVFHEEWIAKLNQDMIDKEINYGVIVTRAVPKNFKYLQWRLNNRIVIIECRDSSIVTTSSILRELIVNEFKVKSVSGLSDTEQGELYKRVLEPSIGMQARDLLQSFIIAQELIDEDVKTAQRSRIKREKLISQQKKQILGIFGAISGSDLKLAENLIGSNDEQIDISQLEDINESKVNII